MHVLGIVVYNREQEGGIPRHALTSVVLRGWQNPPAKMVFTTVVGLVSLLRLVSIGAFMMGIPERIRPRGSNLISSLMGSSCDNLTMYCEKACSKGD